MAKKKSKSDSSSEAATGGDVTDSGTLPDMEVTTDHGEVELLQVDTGDMVKVKQVLDEGVAAALLEYLPEDTVWDNTKLLLMFAACIFATVAQFAPIPFPDSRPLLGFCGAAYFIVSGILQLIQTFIDRDAILWTRPMDDAWKDASAKKFANQDLAQHGLLVRSSFPRFSEFFTVTIQFHLKDEPNPPAVSQTWSVGKFFDKEGYFDEVGLGLEVDKLFEKFDKKQYNTSGKAKKE